MHLLVHIGEQFLVRIFTFIQRWYVGSFLQIFHITISLLQIIDGKIALKVSAKHLFVPMYGDRTISGHILGFVFRLVRIVIGLISYLFIVALSVSVYVFWASLPILIILWGFSV